MPSTEDSWCHTVPSPLVLPGFGSLPCLLNACSSNMKSTSCINLSVSESGAPAQRQRPRVLLKAPTLAEMEEMFVSEVRAGPCLLLSGQEEHLGLLEWAQAMSRLCSPVLLATSSSPSCAPNLLLWQPLPPSRAIGTMRPKASFLCLRACVPRLQCPFSLRAEMASCSVPGEGPRVPAFLQAC